MTSPVLIAAQRVAVRGVAVAGALGLACNIGALAVPLFNMEMFNLVLPTRDVATLWWLCGALAVALASYAVLDHLRSLALGSLADHLAVRLTEPVLAAIAAHGPELDSDPLSDLESLRQFIGSPLCIAPLELIWTPVLLGVMLMMHWGYAVVGLLCCLVLCGFNVLGDVASRKQLLQASHAAVMGLRNVTVAARAAEPVVAMQMLPALAQRWEADSQEVMAEARSAMLRSRAIGALTRTLRMAMTGVMVALGLVLVLQGEASSGSMVAGNMILARLLLPFEQISTAFRSFVEAGAAWHRLRRALEAPVTRRYTHTLAPPTGALVVERLVYIPPGIDRPILRGVSFTLSPGQVLGIIGPSGVGKSSLLRLILGMLAPSSGGVFLDGHSTFLWEREDFARYVGYVPQSLALTNGTVAEVIARMQAPDLAAVRRAAMRVGVHEAIVGLPAGYATRLEGFTLSGGQRQRIAIARAIYGDKRLLILDEPSAFLDKSGEAMMGGLLSELRAQGVGAIMVTHRPSLVDVCDQLLVLRDGLVDRFGTRAEVLQALRGPPVRLVRRGAAS